MTNLTDECREHILHLKSKFEVIADECTYLEGQNAKLNTQIEILQNERNEINHVLNTTYNRLETILWNVEAGGKYDVEAKIKDNTLRAMEALETYMTINMGKPND